MFVDPRPRSAYKLIPVKEFMRRFEALPSEHFEALATDLLEKQTKAYAPAAGLIRRRLDLARQEGSFAHEVVRAYLSVGGLVAFTLSPHGEKFYQLEPFVWSELDPIDHDALVSLDEGILAITPEHYKPNSIDRAVANRPILLASASANRLLKTRPYSPARQHEVAQAIIDEFTANHRSDRMRKADFVAAMRQKLPGLSRDAIFRTWRHGAPDDWKLPGRKNRA
jgi:hypothetical protein